MDIVDKVTRPQIDRNQTAADMKATAVFITWLMCALEIAAWYKYGGANVVAQVFFVLMAIASIVIRPALMNTQLIYRAEGESSGLNLTLLLLNLNIGITIASCLMFFTMHFAEIEEKSRLNSAPVKQAELHLKKMNDALETAYTAMRQAGYTDAQRLSAATQKQALMTQLAAEKRRVQHDNAAATRAYQANVAAFWAKKHPNGLAYADIMDEAGTPKVSRYGYMKSAAASLYPHWQRLQQTAPTAQADPDVQRLHETLNALQPLLAHDLAIKTAQENAAAADAAYWETAQNSPADAHQLKFFEMIAGFINNMTGLNLTSRHIAAGFFTLVVFLFVKGALVIGASADKAKTVVIRKSDMLPGEQEGHSVLSQVFAFVKHLFEKKFKPVKETGKQTVQANKQQKQPVAATAQSAATPEPQAATVAPSPAATPTVAQRGDYLMQPQPHYGFAQPLPPEVQPVAETPVEKNPVGFVWEKSAATPELQAATVAPTAPPKVAANFDVDSFIRVLTLLHQGMSLGEIEKQTGINKGTVSRYINHQGVQYKLVEVVNGKKWVDMDRLSQLQAALDEGHDVAFALSNLRCSLV